MAWEVPSNAQNALSKDWDPKALTAHIMDAPVSTWDISSEAGEQPHGPGDIGATRRLDDREVGLEAVDLHQRTCVAIAAEIRRGYTHLGESAKVIPIQKPVDSCLGVSFCGGLCQAKLGA